MKSVLEAARPQIDQLVSEVVGNTGPRTDGAHAVQRWREAANALAARQANYAYQVYARLKVGSTLEHVVGLACELARSLTGIRHVATHSLPQSVLGEPAKA